MRYLPELFAANARWAEDVRAADPEFFTGLAALQSPAYLWIGCSDSRVPANQITGLKPGEVFVHRNVANVVVHTDLNCLSVLQYAVEVLGVRHVIVCGHYGCGGVKAAMSGPSLGLIDNWLRHIQDVEERHEGILADLPDDETRWRALCELNVVEQVRNVARTTLVGDAWKRGRSLMLHGWIYDLADGRLQDLGVSLQDGAELDTAVVQAVAAARARHEPPRDRPRAAGHPTQNVATERTPR
ncbi:MAG: carbonate dehydratase [Kineosporiaceae bacterium]|nr:carbonate dehydratase [Kineosporiaceae bacterium]